MTEEAVPEIDITKGVIQKGDKLIANPENIPAARAFVAELRRRADEAEQQALASTEAKARRLMQNARQARKDADNIEMTIPNPEAVPGVKEPWQMTLEEYAYAMAEKYGHGKPRIDWIKAGYGETYRTHRTAVERAVKEGKPVPSEVLVDYPDLKPPAMSVVDYDRKYSLEELREKARQEGLSPSGRKKEIAARLIAKGVT